MIDLLKQWATHDPAYCRILTDDAPEQIWKSHKIQVCPYEDLWITCATVYSDGTGVILPEKIMAIREAMEQVMEARGWKYRLRFSESGYTCILKGGDMRSCGKAAGSTEALLAAYVKALGGRKARER